MVDLNKKYSSYASVEFFYLIDNAKEDPAGLIRMRYKAGVEYEFNRIHSVNPFVLLQYGLPFKGNGFVMGFSYSLNIRAIRF